MSFLPDFVDQSNVQLTDRVVGFFGNEKVYDNMTISVGQMYDEVKEIDQNIKVLGDEIKKDADQIQADAIKIKEYGERVVATSTDTQKWRDEAAASAAQAKVSETNAKSSETNAARSAGLAKTSEDASESFSHDAKNFANNALLSEEAAKRSADLTTSIYEDLRKGQVYRGTWNPHTHTYPNAKGTNSVWDVVLNEDETQYNWNGILWYWGDRLVYLKDENKYEQLESGYGGAVISVNNKKGAVTLNAADVGALPITGGTLTGGLFAHTYSIAQSGNKSHWLGLETPEDRNPYISYKASGMSDPRVALTFNNTIINAEARITANEFLVKTDGGLKFGINDNLPGESWGAGMNPDSGNFGIHHYTTGTWKKAPFQIRHTDGVVVCSHGLETPTVNLTGTGNVLSTIGGHIRSNNATVMSLDAKVHAFVTSPNDAHLCRNAYWDGAYWRKYNDNDASAYVACAVGGQLNVYTSAAGSSSPQQLKVLNVSNDGNLTVANSLTANGDTLQLVGDHQNQHLWFKNGAGSERALIYHEGSTNTLNLRVGGTSTAFRVNPNGAAEVMNLHNGHTAFYTTSQVIGDSAAVVRGLVQPGAWVDVYARGSGLQVDVVDSASSATNIWKATHWGATHVAAMDVHRPPSGTVVRLLAWTTAFSFNENGQGLAPGGWHTGSDERFKENIRPLSVQKTSWLDKVCSLNASSFKYKTNDKQSIGFIAQNVQKIIPEAVTAQVDTTKPESERAETERLYLDPMAIIAAQNEAIKELVARIEALERK